MSFLATAEQVAAAGAVVVDKRRKARPIMWASEVDTALLSGPAMLPATHWTHKSAGLRYQREYKERFAGFRVSVEKMVDAKGVLQFVRLNRVKVEA